MGTRSGRRNPGAARSLLFVPASRPDRFDKAVASGTDLVILDLEDAVAPPAKASARTNATAWLSSGGVAAVRLNPADSEHHSLDLQALVDCPGLIGAILPMASSTDDLALMREVLGEKIALLPQIETALGLSRAAELASAPGVVRLCFGHLDFAFDVNAAPTATALTYARSSIVVASRVAGVEGPVDSVSTALDDVAVIRREAAQARELGFTGKLCIHPRQVPVVNSAMSPTATDIEWAKRVLAADTAGAVGVAGHMVDPPVVARAERLLAQVGSEEFAGGSPGTATSSGPGQ